MGSSGLDYGWTRPPELSWRRAGPRVDAARAGEQDQAGGRGQLDRAAVGQDERLVFRQGAAAPCRKTMDIEAHVTLDLRHVLVAFFCGYGKRLHYAARLAFREQPAIGGTSTLFTLDGLHAAIVSRQRIPWMTHL